MQGHQLVPEIALRVPATLPDYIKNHSRRKYKDTETKMRPTPLLSTAFGVGVFCCINFRPK